MSVKSITHNNVRVANVFPSSLCLKLFKNSVSTKQTVQYQRLKVATNEKTQLHTAQCCIEKRSLFAVRIRGNTHALSVGITLYY